MPAIAAAITGIITGIMGAPIIITVTMAVLLLLPMMRMNEGGDHYPYSVPSM